MPANLPKPQSTHRHHRVDALWDKDADKYRVCCRTLHVTQATQFIGYVQLAIVLVFAMSLLFYYGKQINGVSDAESEWMGKGNTRYMTSLMTAVSLQLSLVLMMLHGVRSERRCYLLPFIVFAFFAVFLAFIQVASDVLSSSRMMLENNNGGGGAQLISHVFGMLVHLWCVSVVWRCYCYFGDKKVADQIGEQLQATSLAFAYDYNQPPPYADTVEKHPLTVA